MCYYAELCIYGVDAPSRSDTLMRFDTREERDEMVSWLNCLRGEELVHAVTAREAARNYDLRKFTNDPYGDFCREVKGLRTCTGKTFFELCQRGNTRYQLLNAWHKS